MPISRDQGSKILSHLKNYSQYFTASLIERDSIEQGYITRGQSKDLIDFLKTKVDEGVLEMAVVANPDRRYGHNFRTGYRLKPTR